MWPWLLRDRWCSTLGWVSTFPAASENGGEPIVVGPWEKRCISGQLPCKECKGRRNYCFPMFPFLPHTTFLEELTNSLLTTSASILCGESNDSSWLSLSKFKVPLQLVNSWWKHCFHCFSALEPVGFRRLFQPDEGEHSYSKLLAGYLLLLFKKKKSLMNRDSQHVRNEWHPGNHGVNVKETNGRRKGRGCKKWSRQPLRVIREFYGASQCNM